MRILFICLSQEPGLDGVGDYIFLLSEELIRLGHQVSVIAFNDKYIKGDIETKEHKVGTDGVLKIIRLPSILPSKNKISATMAVINEFDPEWVSLQYVGFGFNKYGLPLELVTLFPKVVKGRQLHIMFHELWCGMGKTAGKKEKILGALQKLFIKSMIVRLKPQSVFTSIQPYADYLAKLNVKTTIVPIFGTIKLNEFNNEQEWQQVLQSADMLSLANNKHNWIVASFFGSIYPRPGLKQLIKDAAAAAVKTNKKLAILSFGGNKLLKLEDIVEGINPVTCWKTGHLSVKSLNNIMAFSDLGIVTSTVDGFDKSTTAIAWIERGIPVMVSAEDKTYLRGLDKKGIYQINGPDDVLSAMGKTGKFDSGNRLKYTAERYLELDKK